MDASDTLSQFHQGPWQPALPGTHNTNAPNLTRLTACLLNKPIHATQLLCTSDTNLTNHNVDPRTIDDQKAHMGSHTLTTSKQSDGISICLSVRTALRSPNIVKSAMTMF